MNLKVKLNLFIGILLVVTIGLVSFFVLQGIKDMQANQTYDTLVNEGQYASVYIRQAFLLSDDQDFKGYLQDQGDSLAKSLANFSDALVVLYDNEGKRVGIATDPQVIIPIDQILSEALKGKIAYQKLGERVDFLMPLKDYQGQVGVLHLIYSVKDQIVFYNAMRTRLLLVGFLILIGSFGMGYMYFSKLSHRIEKCEEDADHIAHLNFTPIVPLRGKDELTRLSHSIANMGDQIHQAMTELEAERSNLTQTVTKLEAIEQAQKRFIANFSHEFKTPLTVIHAHVDLLDMYGDDEVMKRQAISTIKNEVVDLATLSENVLELSKLQQYQFDGDEKSFNLSKLASELTHKFSLKSIEHRVILKVEGEDIALRSDEKALKMICSNLIDNAIKYNRDQGQVTLQLDFEEGNIRGRVQDTGIGISDHDLKRISEPFYRVNQVSREGSGVGLSLVKELIKQRQGTIAFQSQLGQGTIVHFTYPAIKEIP